MACDIEITQETADAIAAGIVEKLRSCCVDSIVYNEDGDQVIVVFDPSTDEVTYYNTDGTPYTGSTEFVDPPASTESTVVQTGNQAEFTQSDGSSATAITALTHKTGGVLDPDVDRMLTQSGLGASYPDWGITTAEMDAWTEPLALRSDGCPGVPRKPSYVCYDPVIAIGPSLTTNEDQFVLTPQACQVVENNTCYPMRVSVWYFVEHIEMIDQSPITDGRGTYICLYGSADGGASFSELFHIGHNVFGTLSDGTPLPIATDMRGDKPACYTIPPFSSQEFCVEMRTCYSSGDYDYFDTRYVNPRAGIFITGGCA